MESPKTSLAYRPEIDGLRALAVLAVVLYHAGVPYVTGGFVGVDVFFVISGFLITSLILKERAEGAFTFKGFWLRRARRILPAQLAVIAVTLAACYFLYFPQDMLYVVKQALSQFALVSNIFFYTQSGYFAPNAFLKPLLHLWSLAVEEQFYLLFPLLFWMVGKWQKGLTAFVFGGLALVSFAACIWMTAHNSNTAFYLLPFRAWELLLGALVAFLPRSLFKTKLDEEVAGCSGLFLIVLSIFGFTADTPFPGVAALIPCIGAFLVIASNSAQRNIAGKVFSHPVPVFVGLISYSLYLWHWPVLMIAEYFQPGALMWTQKLGLVALSGLLAAASWQWIEKPFRNHAQKKSSRNFVVMMVGTTAILCCLCVGFVWQQAIQAKYVDIAKTAGEVDFEKNPYIEPCKIKTSPFKDGDVCQTNPQAGPPTFALLGDSFAMAATPMYFDLSQKYGRNGYILFKIYCPPFLDLYRNQTDGEQCHAFNKQALDFIKQKNIKNVFMVGNWAGWFRLDPVYFKQEDPDQKQYQLLYNNLPSASLRRTIDTFLDLNIKVYFVIGEPTLRFEVPHFLAIEKKIGIKTTKAIIPKKDYLHERALHLDLFVSSLRSKPVVFVDPIDLLCPENDCITSIDGRPLYMDANHLSYEGAKFEEPLLEPYFKNGFSTP